MYCNRPGILLFVGLTVVNLVIWTGLFFGLNYHEIVVNRDYAPTDCSIDASTVVPRYCATYSCSVCSAAPSWTQDCDALVSQINTLNPALCNSSSSPNCGISQMCNEGYKCCSTCCDTCESCSMVCDANQVCTKKCSYYKCRCRCCSSVDSLSCYLDANTCYTSVLQLHYQDLNDETIYTSYSKDFDQDLASANQYVSTDYQSNNTYACFYDTTNEQDILWSIGYHTGYWIVTGLFSFTLLLCLIGLVDQLVLAQLNDDDDRQMLILARCIQCLIWTSLVVPFALFLPLSLSVTIQDGWHKALVVLFWQFLTLGPLPLLYFVPLTQRLLGLYIITCYIPIGWLAPFHDEIASNLSTSQWLVILVLSSLCSFVGGLFLISRLTRCIDWLLSTNNHNNNQASHNYVQDDLQDESLPNLPPPSFNQAIRQFAPSAPPTYLEQDDQQDDVYK